MENHLPTAQHTHTVILLHGHDSTATEFAAEFFESQASDDRTLPEIFPGIKWVFQSAGMLRSSRFGCDMSQWFDMHSTEDPHEQEEMQDMSASIRRIQESVAQEAAIIGAGKVMLGGISQGCAVAVHALLKGQMRFGGFIGLCSWLPRAQEITVIDKALLAIRTPVLLCHAQDDDVIAIRFGLELRDTLIDIGMEVRWRGYEDGGHWINEPRGVDDMVAFLEECCCE